jgi:hypothetical protein
VPPDSLLGLQEKPVKKTILIFGLISGALISLMMALTLPFQDKIGLDHSLVIGYTTIVLSMLLIFFGIRSYRDNVGKGHITFAKAFAVGISITIISCICYVVCWEIIYFNFMPDFADKYSAQVIQKMQASGATAAAIQAQVEKLKEFKTSYANPFYNVAMTFIEPFPVGLLITLVSAAFLRKKPQSQQAQSPVAA